MSQWPSTKARLVLAALLRIGWEVKRSRGTSHRVLSRSGWPDFVFAFHDKEEIGPRQLYIALDQGYISQEKFDELYSKSDEVARLLSGFIRYVLSKPKKPKELK